VDDLANLDADMIHIDMSSGVSLHWILTHFAAIAVARPYFVRTDRSWRTPRGLRCGLWSGHPRPL